MGAWTHAADAEEDPVLVTLVRPRADWIAMRAVLRPCFDEVVDVGDAYRDHGYWNEAEVLMDGMAALDGALVGDADPVAITRSRTVWHALLRAFDLGRFELGHAGSHARRGDFPAPDPPFAAFEAVLLANDDLAQPPAVGEVGRADRLAIGRPRSGA